MKVEFYRTKVWKQWRWRIKAANNRIIGSSSEGYWNKKDCEHNLELNYNALKQYYANNN